MSVPSTDSDETTEAAALRAKYLPISRKELRRRRESGLDASSEKVSTSEPDAAHRTQDDAPDPAAEASGAMDHEAEAEEARQKRREELAAIARESAGQDPTHVDPDLLKRQQALVAEAMRANAERGTSSSAGSEASAPESEERRESAIITRKALRSTGDDEDKSARNEHTGSIEPVHARGAHGLELDELIQHSATQARRRVMMMWLLILVAVLLAVVVGVLIFTII